jgi:hypothetical protein
MLAAKRCRRYPMKKGIVPACVAVGLLISLMLTGCATMGAKNGESAGQKSYYIPAVDEALFGTWVNPELSPPAYAQKVVFYPWGLVESYNSVDGTVYDWRGTATIVAR